MPATAAELAAIITADTRGLDEGLRKADQSLQSFGATITRLGTQLSIGLTAPLTAAGAAILHVGMDYERAMNIFGAVTKATGEEMAKAGKLAEQLGADMQLPATSAGDAAKAMTELAKGGLTASQAMDAARGTLQLAAAAGVEEARAAEIAANALNAFGLQASQAATISDLLAAAANASSAEINDIALSLQQASAVFASAHVSVQDLTTAIALMANAGIKGSDAGTSLKTMMIALEAPTNKAAEEMKRLHINIFDANGSFIPFREMIANVSKALEGMTDKQQAQALKTIFGTDAIRAANIVMAKGVEQFDKMSEAVNRAGAAQELAGARAKGLSGALDGLKSQLETVGLKLSQSVAPQLEGLTRKLADVIGKFSELTPGVQRLIVVLGGLTAAVGPVLVIFGQLATSINNIGILAGTLGVRLGSLAGAFGLVGAAAAAATVAAEIKWSQSQARFLAGIEQSQHKYNSFGQEIVKVTADMAGKVPKLVNGMTADLTVSLDKAADAGAKGGGKTGKGIKDGVEEGTKGAAKAVEDFSDAAKKSLEEAGKAAETSGFFMQHALEGIAEAAENLDDHLAVEAKLLPTFSAAIQTATDAIINQGKAVKDLIGFGRDWENFYRAATLAQDAAKKAADELKKKFEDLSHSLPQSWNIIIDSFVKRGTELGVKVKGIANDILGVFDNLPGKWGQAFDRTITEVNKWISLIDSAIKLIQRILGDNSPSGLGGILSKVGGIFKKTTQDIQTSTEDWAGTLEKMSTGTASTMGKAASGVESGAGRIVGAFTQIAGAALAFIGSKGAGFAGGALSGALGGIAAAGGIATALGVALSPLTLGLSALGGALLGGILGLFGGKSAEQKAAEARQLEQAKLNLQQTAQNVINAAIEGFDKALQFFEHLDEFTQVRKEKFRAFFANLTRLMNSFVELSKVWSTETLAQAKALADSVGPIADAVGGAVSALTSLLDFKPVADETIDAFTANLQHLVQKMGEAFDSLAKELIKHGRKLAENLEAISSVISPLIEGFGKMLEFKPVDEAAMDAFIDSLKMFVSKMGALADSMDLGGVKFTARFAEAVSTILGVIKTGVEALGSLADFKGVAPEAFQALLDGFDQAISIMDEMLDRATQFESIAMQIEGKLTSAADHLKAGAAAMAAGLTAATSTTSSATAGGTVGAASLGSGAAAGPTVVQYIVQGSLIRESELENLHMNYNETNRRRGRLLTVTA